MALKFLNKKGWHTGSLRNIENVWKAEQKHEAEKRKLEELKKQILDEREAQEFRQLQEQAGLIPKQERLEFLYDSGLAVGRSTTDDYLLGKPVEETKEEDDVAKVAAAPGSLFVEEKPQSANDTWRKLHTDPLLLIKQQEQAALARIKNNPVKMDLIKRSVEEKIGSQMKRKHKDGKKHKRSKKMRAHESGGRSKTTESSPDSKVLSDDDESGDRFLASDDRGRKEKLSKEKQRMELPVERDDSHKRKHSSLYRKNDSSPRKEVSLRKHDRHTESKRLDSSRRRQESPTYWEDGDKPRHGSPERRGIRQRDSPRRWHGSPERGQGSPKRKHTDSPKRRHDSPKRGQGSPKRKHTDSPDRRRGSPKQRHDISSKRFHSSDKIQSMGHGELAREKQELSKSFHDDIIGSDRTKGNKQQTWKQPSGKLTEEEKAARLKAMQSDAEAHEEQRWHRLKKASDADRLEEEKRLLSLSGGRNFVEQTARNLYGAGRGGSASVEESVRRRTHFIERSLGDGNFNTFQR